MGIIIKGTGRYTPEKVLTNADLEKMVDTNDEWIKTRTGIEKRHIGSADQACSDFAYEASLKALEKAGLEPMEIDVILVATVTPDMMFPSTACILQQRLGALNAFAFDISAACSGLLYATTIANSLLKSNDKYKNCLVIGSEKLSSITNWNDRNTCVLFGDGSGALVLSKDDTVDYDAILAVDLHADGNYGKILNLPSSGSRMPVTAETIEKGLKYIHMEGKETFKLAVNAMVSAAKNVLLQAGLEAKAVRWIIPHQANSRIIEAVASRLGVEDGVVFQNIQNYGNTSAASIGICLSELNDDHKIERGDYVLLCSFGGGLTWGSILLKW